MNSDNGVKQLSSTPQPATSNSSCCEPDGDIDSSEGDGSDEPPPNGVEVPFAQPNRNSTPDGYLQNTAIAHGTSCISAGIQRGTDSREFEETYSLGPLDQNLKCLVCGKVFRKGQIQKYKHHAKMCPR